MQKFNLKPLVMSEQLGGYYAGQLAADQSLFDLHSLFQAVHGFQQVKPQDDFDAISAKLIKYIIGDDIDAWDTITQEALKICKENGNFLLASGIVRLTRVQQLVLDMLAENEDFLPVAEHQFKDVLDPESPFWFWDFGGLKKFPLPDPQWMYTEMYALEYAEQFGLLKPAQVITAKAAALHSAFHYMGKKPDRKNCRADVYKAAEAKLHALLREHAQLVHIAFGGFVNCQAGMNPEAANAAYTELVFRT